MSARLQSAHESNTYKPSASYYTGWHEFCCSLSINVCVALQLRQRGSMRPSMMRPVIVDARVSLRREPRRWRALILLLALSALAGFIGSLASPGMSESASAWYEALRKPDWTPPNALFSVAWTILYALMAVAAWLVWRDRHRDLVRPALGLYAVQLGLNASWSLAYFGLRSPGTGLVVIIALLIVLGLTIRAFARLNRIAAALLAPYFAWVLFAAALNASIWWMNR
jgi:translocator protein